MNREEANSNYRKPFGQDRQRMAYIKFPIVIYPSEDKEGGAYTAHCLNMDLVHDENTIEGAVSGLLETIEVALDEAANHNANAFSRAPSEYWSLLASGQELPAELRERIIFHANKRRAAKRATINVEAQCDLRQAVTV